MKKIIVIAASLFITISSFAAPSSRIIQAFKETFPNAENVKWYDDTNGYFVSFYQHGNFEKVFYNKDGDFVRSWKYSDGKDLPTNIVMALKKKYDDVDIKGVTELTSQDNVVYTIQFTKAEKLYSIQMSADGNISKEQKYKNANAE